MPVSPRAGPRPRAISTPAFVGRAGQLDLLTRALAQPPALVLVEGEAGIGKSRLIREFLAGEAGAHRALVGTCPPYRVHAPLAPVVETLRPYRERVPGLALSGLAGALRPLLPEWAADLPPPPEQLGDQDAARHRLYRALAELIGRLGATVLVLDDAHWADSGTLEFLLFLATRQQAGGRLDGRGLSLVVTYRPEDVPAESPLRRLSSRRPGVTQVRLAPPLLGVADTAALVSSMLGGAEVSEAFATFLHERTEGLPLAVEESVHLLGDRADIVRRHGGWLRGDLAGMLVPPTVRDSTLERFRRRSRAAQRVLQAAAVVAVPADEATLAAVAGTPEPVLRAAVTEAMAVGLLREGDGQQRGRLAFRHVLSAAAVYEAIPGPQRRRLHRRAGHVLARREPPPAAQLARHFRHGGDPARWARWAERAADAAGAASDHVTATALLEQLPGVAALPVAVRVRLAGKLAGAALYLQVADPARVDRIVAGVRRVLGIRGLAARDRGRLRNLLGRLLNQRGEPAAAFAELARSVPHLRHAPVEAARTMINLGWPRTGSWPAGVHLRWLRRADRLPTDTMTPVDRLSLQVDRATALLHLGAVTGWEVAAALPATVDSPEERLHLARGWLNIGDAAMHWGHYPRARQLLTAGLELARANQFERVEAIVAATLTRLDWLTGAWGRLGEQVGELVGEQVGELVGEQVGERAGGHTGVVDAPGPAPAHTEDMLLVAGWLAAVQGRPEQAEPPLRQALEDARRHGWVMQELAPAAALATLHLAAGRAADALAVTDGPMATLAHKQIWIWATDLAPVRVAALLAAGRPGPAGDLVAAFGAGLAGRHTPAARAALATCRAMLLAHHGAGERAVAGFAAAARAWEALPRPYEALLARERLAHAHLAGGDPEAGLAELERAGHGLRQLGARGAADRIAAELQQRGVAAVPRWRGGRRGYGDQLSPREREVVALVVAGRTNREIAQLLAKAPGTVAGQLRSAMRKLGVTSRTALAVRAIEGDAPGVRGAGDSAPGGGR